MIRFQRVEMLRDSKCKIQDLWIFMMLTVIFEIMCKVKETGTVLVWMKYDTTTEEGVSLGGCGCNCTCLSCNKDVVCALHCHIILGACVLGCVSIYLWLRLQPGQCQCWHQCSILSARLVTLLHSHHSPAPPAPAKKYSTVKVLDCRANPGCSI